MSIMHDARFRQPDMACCRSSIAGAPRPMLTCRRRAYRQINIILCWNIEMRAKEGAKRLRCETSLRLSKSTPAGRNGIFNLWCFLQSRNARWARIWIFHAPNGSMRRISMRRMIWSSRLLATGKGKMLARLPIVITRLDKASGRESLHYDDWADFDYSEDSSMLVFVSELEMKYFWKPYWRYGWKMIKPPYRREVYIKPDARRILFAADGRHGIIRLTTITSALSLCAGSQYLW